MVLEFYYSFHPTPAYPLNIMMYAFFIFVGLLVAVCVARRAGLTRGFGVEETLDELSIGTLEAPLVAATQSRAGLEGGEGSGD